MWGCKTHWFRLPKIIRDRIWQTYIPGQEIRKDPSRDYLVVARGAQKWIDLAKEFGDEKATVAFNRRKGMAFMTARLAELLIVATLAGFFAWWMVCH